MKITINGKKYELTFLSGELTTKRDIYEGHFEILAKKDGKYYKIEEIKK